MKLSRRRPTAALLALLFALAASPAAAVDPTPSPEPTEPALTSPPTVHAEMEAEHRDDAATQVAGPRPQGLDTASLDGGVTLAGGDALPNGLSHEVLGYLPYWAVTAEMVAHLDYDLLSTIAYFGVPATSTGDLSKTHVGWTTWNSATMTNVVNAAHAEGVKVVLTVTMMAWDGNYTNMSALLNNSTRRTKLAGQIADAVAARSADGVNLDFEPMPNALQAAYTQFVRDVRTAIGSTAHLSVATTGGAATWDEGYDLAGITGAGAADALMVMGYDFNWSGSARAGGVSPIESPYALDVQTAMANYLARVPGSKLIWGVPYYGRAWTTTGSTVNGRTCSATGSCTAASWSIRYDDAVEGAAAKGRKWDAVGQVPWYTYLSPTYDEQVQAYYDDAVSLDVKHELIIANGLRGVGIWHLTMDGSRRELWDQLWRNYGDLPFRDIDDSDFLEHIIWLAAEGITTGCGNERFCPLASVTRAEMAGFLARALDLTGGSVDRFSDDNGSVHELSINRIAEAGITSGCTSSRFCPDHVVTRGQMASFIDRALDLPSTNVDAFTDDEGLTYENAINRLAAAGIASGCASNRYCPSSPVSREQMAAFLHRALAP
jgi:spore germination protein YaaH